MVARVGLLALLLAWILLAETAARVLPLAWQVAVTILVVGSAAALSRMTVLVLHLPLFPGRRHDVLEPLLVAVWSLAWTLLVLHMAKPLPVAAIVGIAAAGMACWLFAFWSGHRRNTRDAGRRRGHRPGTALETQWTAVSIGAMLLIFIITVSAVILFGLGYFFVLSYLTHGDRNLVDAITIVLFGLLLLGITAGQWLRGRP